MKKIPIMFCFNKAYLIPAFVSIYSLLDTKSKNTFYDIFIFYDDEIKDELGIFDSLKKVFSDYQINYIYVGDLAKKFFVSGYLSIQTYYRLFMPYLISQYDKALYSDVDIIFKKDLSEFYDIDVNGYCVAGSKGNYRISDLMKEIAPSVKEGVYINAGNLLLNLKEIREGNYKDEIIRLVKLPFPHHDQDVLNVVFQDKIKYISPKFAFLSHKDYESQVFKDIDIKEIEEKRFLTHFAGDTKPWHTKFVNFASDWYSVFNKAKSLINKTKVKEFIKTSTRIKNFKTFTMKVGLYPFFWIVKRFIVKFIPFRKKS